MRFPDIEADVIAFLETRVDVPVTLAVPADRPDSFLRVWRNGGFARNRIVDVANITVEAWAADDAAASELARQAREALLSDYTAMPLVRGVAEVVGPYFTPDPDSETPRYRFTEALTVRASRI